MRLALQPFASAGVALVGASVMAITPITMTPNGSQELTTRVSSAAVELNALVNPIDQWTQIGETAQAQVAYLQSYATRNGYPFPIVRQLVSLQQTRSAALATALQNTGAQLVTLFDPSNPAGTPAMLNAAFAALASGDPKTAINKTYAALMGVTIPIGMNLLGPVFSLITNPVDDMTKVIDQSALVFTSYGFGALAIMGATQEAVATAVGDLATAAGSGDPEQFANALLSAPGTVIGGVLNGNAGGSGVLGNGGLALQMLSVPRIIARALGAPRTFPQPTVVPSAITAELSAPPVAAPPTLESDTPTATEATADTAEATPKDDTKALVRVSPKTAPGDLPGSTTTTTRAKPRTAMSNTVRKSISDTVKNVSDGFKKAASSLGGKKAKGTESASSGADAG